MPGQDIFLHVKDCGNFIPKAGALVSFDIEDSPVKPGQKVTKNAHVVQVHRSTGVPRKP